MYVSLITLLILLYSQLDQSKSFDSHNSTTVVCGSCKSIIMKPSCGRLVEKEVSKFSEIMTEKNCHCMLTDRDKSTN